MFSICALVSFACILLAVKCRCKSEREERLWVDGNLTTCAESGLECAQWFCEDCVYSKSCDLHCNYEIIDCQGTSLTDSQCLAERFGYYTCSDWIGNGCCDDGHSYTADSGIRPDFNCAKFNYDHGDCHSSDLRRASPSIAEKRKDWCILLTATVCPVEGATHIVRKSSKIRRADYSNSVAKYLNATTMPIVFVENSNANLNSLYPDSNQSNIEFISFRDTNPEPGRGKGHAEYRSILYALEHSNVLNQQCSHIVKVTGRYFISNLNTVITQLQALRPQPQIVVQSTPSPWTLYDGVLRSEVVAFKNDPHLARLLFADQDETTGHPMERVLFNAVQRIKHEGIFPLSQFPALQVDPTPNAEHTHIISLL